MSADHFYKDYPILRGNLNKSGYIDEYNGYRLRYFNHTFANYSSKGKFINLYILKFITIKKFWLVTAI